MGKYAHYCAWPVFGAAGRDRGSASAKEPAVSLVIEFPFTVQESDERGALMKIQNEQSEDGLQLPGLACSTQ